MRQTEYDFSGGPRNLFSWMFWLVMGISGYCAMYGVLASEHKLERGISLEECLTCFWAMAGIGLVVGRGMDVGRHSTAARGFIAGAAGFLGALATLIVGAAVCKHFGIPKNTWGPVMTIGVLCHLAVVLCSAAVAPFRRAKTRTF